MQYKIKKGDTLSAISKKLGISVKDLAAANKIKDVNKIQAGASLIIPQPKKKKPSSVERVQPQKTKEIKPKKIIKSKQDKSKYIVKKGDNLFDIAKLNSLSPSQLIDANPQIEDINKIKVGQKINVPQFNIDRQEDFAERINLPAEESRERFLPSNVRQLISDINPINRFRRNQNLGMQDFTEGDLDKDELNAARELVKKIQAQNRSSISYEDFDTSQTGISDVGGGKGFGLTEAFNKFKDPMYALKTLIGRGNITTNDAGETIITDRYNFNEPEAESLGDYQKKLSLMQQNPFYQIPRQLGSVFGSNEGEGSFVRLNLGKIGAANGGQTRYNFNKGGSMNIQQQTQNVAAQGRYGDSMLLHVNPAEIKGLAQAMPITINPETGQPEAFLPFLAPILGSVLGSSLLTGVGGGALGGLIGSSGLSSLAAGAIGSGLAQTAVTGDLKKGLLAGLTGYGIGSALQGAAGAAGAQAGTDVATSAVTTAGEMGTEAGINAINQATQQAGAEAAKTAASSTGIQNLQSAFGNNMVGSNVINPLAEQGFGQAINPNTFVGAGAEATGNQLGSGVGNLMQGLSQPSAYIPAGIGMGGTSIMESQELFAQQEADRLRRYNEDREEMYRNAPEPILYSANGGMTNFRRGGYSGETIDDDGIYTGGDLPQIYAPDKQTYDVNPNFMAGFAPETMYFNPSTISAPASNLTTSGPPAGVDTYEGSKGGFGGMQASIAPQTSIDPFAAYTGQAPAGLEFTAPTPPPPPELPPITPPPDGPPIVPPIYPPYDGPINIPGIGGEYMDFGGFGNLDFSGINIPGMSGINIPGMQGGLGDLDFSGIDFSQFNPNAQEELATGVGQGFMIEPPVNVPKDFTIPNGSDFSIQRPDEMMFPGGSATFDETGGGLAPSLPAMPTAPVIGKPMDDFMSIDRLPMDFDERDFGQTIGRPPEPIMAQPMPVAPPAMQQPMPPQIIPSMPNETSVPFVPPVSMPQPVSGIDERDFMDSIGITPPNVPQPIMQQPMPSPVQQPIPQLAPEVLAQLPPEVIQQLMPSPVMMPAPSVNMGLPKTRMTRPATRGRAEGGPTLKDIPADNKGLPNLPTSVRNEMGFKQAGGETEVDPLIAEVTAFILGESENNEALNAFIQKYGNEAFMQLRQQILQSLVPNAQTEGQIQGDGNGGMDDDLFGRIGNKERIAVSQDEFIVPADVVSMLGDGSSDAGSKELYDMMDRVRNEKTGTTKQAPRLANAGGMLPA